LGLPQILQINADFYFYNNAEKSMQLVGELQLIEKWAKRINDQVNRQ